jgi:Domain of unknown function (DUF4180)
MPAYFEPDTRGGFDAKAIVTESIESGSRAILLDGGGLPPEFFDLSSSLAGELLHRMGLYEMRLAAVVPDPTEHSRPFQDFVREANRGHQFRFFATRQEAIDWLEGN